MSMKNSLTPAGIEPATFRFAVQHLNHCATAVPIRQISDCEDCGNCHSDSHGLHKSVSEIRSVLLISMNSCVWGNQLAKPTRSSDDK